MNTGSEELTRFSDSLFLNIEKTRGLIYPSDETGTLSDKIGVINAILSIINNLVVCPYCAKVDF